MNRVDLHVHSNKSDGSYTPTELVNYAIEKGLSAFALTDHDTTDGIEEALAAAKGKNIEVIPGIEFSSEYEGKDIHIVGLYIDYKSDFFKRRLEAFVNGRILRNQEMCQRLQEVGVTITYEQLLAEFPDCVITRSHYAKFLLNHGYTRSMKEGFERYIGDYAPCFVSRKKITPMRAIEIILKAGGIPILAHPTLYHMSSSRLDELVAKLKAVGLVGIEAIYSTYSSSEERDIRKLALKYDLAISGGSDFHGTAKPGLDLAVGYGKLFIPEEVLTNLSAIHEQLLINPYKPASCKILFTDLDGTFLDSNKQISDYTRSVLDEWSRAGHKLVLCSGRDMNSVKDVQESLHLDYPGMYLIGYNGGQIWDCDKQETIYKTTLTLEQIAYIQEQAKLADIHFHTYDDAHVIAHHDDKELKRYFRVIHTPVLYAEDVTSVMSEGSCKCLLIDLENHDKLEQFRESLLPYAGDDLTLLFSNPYYLEIFPAIAGKGNAVRNLCSMLEIPIAYSIAAGDAENDLSMIEAAGMGIAMCNGSEEIKKAATTITAQDNDHDGLALVLRDLM